jgi:hypothetical protein
MAFGAGGRPTGSGRDRPEEAARPARGPGGRRRPAWRGALEDDDLRSRGAGREAEGAREAGGCLRLRPLLSKRPRAIFARGLLAGQSWWAGAGSNRRPSLFRSNNHPGQKKRAEVEGRRRVPVVGDGCCRCCHRCCRPDLRRWHRPAQSACVSPTFCHSGDACSGGEEREGGYVTRADDGEVTPINRSDLG